MIHVYDRSPPKNSSDNPAMLHQRLNLHAAQDPDTPQSVEFLSYFISSLPLRHEHFVLRQFTTSLTGPFVYSS